MRAGDHDVDTEPIQGLTEALLLRQTDRQLGRCSFFIFVLFELSLSTQYVISTAVAGPTFDIYGKQKPTCHIWKVNFNKLQCGRGNKRKKELTNHEQIHRY